MESRRNRSDNGDRSMLTLVTADSDVLPWVGADVLTDFRFTLKEIFPVSVVCEVSHIEYLLDSAGWTPVLVTKRENHLSNFNSSSV